MWKGYAPVEMWEPIRSVWQPTVLEVTEALEERLRGRELRGEVWALQRPDIRGEASPVTGVLVETVSSADLREPFDIEPVLRRLWHCGPLRLGINNKLPAKLMLSDSPGKAPALPMELSDNYDPKAEEADKEAAAEVWRQFYEKQRSFNGHSRKNGQTH